MREYTIMSKLPHWHGDINRHTWDQTDEKEVLHQHMLAAVSDLFALLAEETQLCIFALLKPQCLKTERMCTCERILSFDLNRKPQEHQRIFSQESNYSTVLLIDNIFLPLETSLSEGLCSVFRLSVRWVFLYILQH